MVSRFVIKKLAGVVAVLAVFVVIAIVCVACSDEEAPKAEGVVYGVTFSTGLDEWVVERQSVEEGNKAVEPAPFLREGYDFLGWKDGDRFWNFETDTVNKSIELVAVWVENLESWEYTEGLQFSYVPDLNGYQVVGYMGTEGDVVIPLYYSGVMGVKKVVRIEASAFQKIGIKSVSLPSTISEIGKSAFAGTQISEIVLSKNVTRVSDGAFASMPNLSRIEFLNRTDDITIGKGAFRDCANLKNVNLPDNVVSIGESCFENSGIETLNFGSGSRLNKIGENAFKSTNLKNVKLPENLKVLASGAFSGCEKLATIVIPSGLQTVGENVLSGCSLIRAVYYSGDIPAFAENNWTGINKIVEYSYSKKNVNEPFKWHYSAFGIPVAYEKSKEISINGASLSAISTPTDPYRWLYIVIRQYYDSGKGLVNASTKDYTLDDAGKTKITIDEFAGMVYTIEVHAGKSNTGEWVHCLVRAQDVDANYSSVTLENPTTATASVDVVYN